MPDISEVNGTAISNLAEVDGLTVSGGGSSFTGLLDQTYGSGAAAAYSVRRLSSSTGALLRVRRVTGVGNTGNDDEADFGYDSNNVLSLNSPISNADAGVNSTTLGSFLNVGTVSGVTYPDTDSLTSTAEGYCDSWYDQSGNSNDAIQSTPGDQPKIHDGTVNTDLITENGKATLDFDGAGDHFPLDVTANGLNLDVANTSSFHVGKYDDSTPAFILSLGGSSPSSNRWYPGYHNSTLRYGYGVYSAANSETGDTNQNLFTMIAGSTLGGAEAWRNGSSKMTAPLASSAIMGDSVGIGRFRTTFYLDGNVQEVLIYDSDQSTNRSGIEGNMNSHFQIY